MTARSLLLESARELKEAGVLDPEYDAALLLSRVTGEKPLALRAGFDIALTEEQIRVFRMLAGRRKRREPLQYLLGDAVFIGLTFRVRPGVLIPRPETEMLAGEAVRRMRERIGRLKPEDPGPEALDLCCGSGCIGLSLKKILPRVRCTLTDRSREALETARENAEILGTECEILEGDLFAPVRERRFDLILSNPPYIPAAECESLQPEVAAEPRAALDGGADGLDFYRRIAKEAPARLLPGGALILEIGAGEGERVRDMLKKHGAVRVETEKDFSGIERMIAAEY